MFVLSVTGELLSGVHAVVSNLILTSYEIYLFARKLGVNKIVVIRFILGFRFYCRASVALGHCVLE